MPLRTIKMYNLDLYDSENIDGVYKMPIIHKEDIIPSDLLGFNYAMTTKPTHYGIHMFLDDYQIERLWNNPDKYLDVLKRFQCVLSPDFSLYLDMPIAMKIWNTYRSRLLGQYLQKNGIRVIPTVSWAQEDTFSFCFDGIERGSVVAISTIGVKRNKNALQIWKDGVSEMVRRIEPKVIICYGGKVDHDFGNTRVIYFDNANTDRMKGIG